MDNQGFSIEENKSNGIHKTVSYQDYFNRQHLNLKEIDEKYMITPFKSDNIFQSTKNYLFKYYKPNKNCMKGFLFNRIPFIKWIRKYNVRENLAKDLIAGLTIGVIQIPQGMAYSLMAGLPPIIGLYVSLWSVLVYFFLGTSRHLSLGNEAVTSLMIHSCILKLEGKYYPRAEHSVSVNKLFASNSTQTSIESSSIESTTAIHSNLNSEFLSNDPKEAKIMIGTALAFYTGIIQVLFAIFHVGVVTKYLPDIVISAFTIGASYHIVVSQLASMLGLKKPLITTPFKIIEELVGILSNIAMTNSATLIISIVSLIFIFCVKYFINERFKEKMFAPIPIDLIVVIFGTLLSHLFNFNKNWNVDIIGEIPIGIPKPFLPPFKILPDIIDCAINIAIISFALNISIAKLFSKKYKYDINANQELFSYGAGNLVCSFLSGFPSCAAISRAVILDNVGGKTQIFGLVSSLVVLIKILAIGPLLKTLPKACLAASIAVALARMMFQVTVLKEIYKKSKFEAVYIIIWFITFASVVLLDINLGLYIGIAVSILLIIVQSQRATASTLGNIPFTDIYESINLCEEAREFQGIKIIRYESSIFYANVENFIYKVIKLSGINTNEILKRINKLKASYESQKKNLKPNKMKKILNRKNSTQKDEEIGAEIEKLNDEMKQKIDEILQAVPTKDIILDFSCVNFIDTMGINAIVQVKELFEEIGVELHMAYCKRSIFRAFGKNSFQEKMDYSNIYPTIHDAVMGILRKKKSQVKLIAKRKNSIDIHVIETENKKNTPGTDEFITDSNKNEEILPMYKNRSESEFHVFQDIDPHCNNNNSSQVLNKNIKDEENQI